MGREIDLMKNYPRTKRDTKKRGVDKTESDREIARQFEKDFFDEVKIRRFWSIITEISQMGSYAWAKMRK